MAAPRRTRAAISVLLADRNLNRTPVTMRAPMLLLLCSTLAACSDSVDFPPMAPYVPPSMPTEQVLSKGITQAVADAKLIGTIEVSDVRPTDHGPGPFMLCIRGVSNDSRTGTYAVFFDDKADKGLRLPAILEGCEKQNYHPFVPVAEPKKPDPAKPTGKART